MGEQPPNSMQQDTPKLTRWHLKRALNLARDTAVRINGGLSNFRPARCMYQSISKNPCLAHQDANGFLFQFPGGSPGWQETGMTPALVTVLKISADGRSVTQAIH